MLITGSRGSYASGIYSLVLCVLSIIVVIQCLYSSDTSKQTKEAELISSAIIYGLHFVASMVLFVGLRKRQYKLIIPHILSTTIVTVFNIYIVLYLAIQLPKADETDADFKSNIIHSIFLSCLIVIINVFCLIIVNYHGLNLYNELTEHARLNNEYSGEIEPDTEERKDDVKNQNEDI